MSLMVRSAARLLPTGPANFDVIGAGGFATGGEPALDGTMLYRLDTSGPVLRGPGMERFKRMMRVGSIVDPTLLTDASYPDVSTYDATICYGNSQIAYFVINGWTWKTANGGDTVTRTALAQQANCFGNDKARTSGKMLAVDPANGSVVLFGTPAGLQKSADGGDSWAAVSTGTIPVPRQMYRIPFDAGVTALTRGQTITGATSGAVGILIGDASLYGGAWNGTGTGALEYFAVSGTFVDNEALQISGVTKATANIEVAPEYIAQSRIIIAFDRSSAVVSSKTQGIYIFVNGHGLYHSTDGGATWPAVSGAPSSACHMRVSAANGYVHIGGVASAADGQYHRWNKSSWTQPASAAAIKAIALSILNAGRMWAVDASGKLQVSTDDGVNWSSKGDPLRVAPNIPWMAFTNESFMSNGSLDFNPADGSLELAQGLGAWGMASPPTSISGPVSWTEKSRGIENMVSTLVDVGSDGRLLYACHDRTAFALPRTYPGIVYPSRHAKLPDISILHGGNVDFAPGNPNFLVANSYREFRANICGDGFISTDGGENWSPMPGSLTTASGGQGHGNIVALSEDVFLQVETLNGKLSRTTDGGWTWNQCTIGNNLDTEAHFSYFLSRRILVKDKFNPGHAFFYNVGSNDVGGTNALACRGIWKTDDFASSWVRVLNGFITGHDFDKYHGKLRQLGPNEWLWCCGDNGFGLWHSNDNMASWTEVTGYDNIFGSVRFGEVFGIAVGNGWLAVAGHRQASPADATNYNGFGLWVTNHAMTNWTRWVNPETGSHFPGDYYNQPNDIAADPDEPFVYIGQRGEGATKVVVAV